MVVCPLIWFLDIIWIWYLRRIYNHAIQAMSPQLVFQITWILDQVPLFHFSQGKVPNVRSIQQKYSPLTIYLFLLNIYHIQAKPNYVFNKENQPQEPYTKESQQPEYTALADLKTSSLIQNHKPLISLYLYTTDSKFWDPYGKSTVFFLK